MPQRPATVRLGAGTAGRARGDDIICHVNVARGYRGGERQTELLIRGIASWGLNQRLIARRGEPLSSAFNDLPDLEIREVGGSAYSVMRHASGCALLHIHEGRSVHAASLRQRFFGTPYVITRRVDNPIRKNAATRRAYRNAAAVVVVSSAVANAVGEFDASVKTRLIADASSALPSFKASAQRIRERYAGKFIVGHIGALDHSHKGQEDIISAAQELGRTHPQIQFVLLGTGRDAKRFEELAAALPNVDLPGFVDNIGDWLAAFDAFVFPSLHEGLGSVLLDAMDFGLPIVATRVGGIRDIVKDNVNGLLIQPANPDQLRFAVLRLHDDRDLGTALGERGRQIVQDYLPERMVERYLDIYQPLLGGLDALAAGQQKSGESP